MIEARRVHRLHRRLAGQKQRGLGERRSGVRKRLELQLRAGEILPPEINLPEFHAHLRQELRRRALPDETPAEGDHFLFVARRGCVGEKNRKIRRAIRVGLGVRGLVGGFHVAARSGEVARRSLERDLRECQPRLAHAPVLGKIPEEQLQRFLRPPVPGARLQQPFLQNQITPHFAFLKSRAQLLVVIQKTVVVALVKPGKRGVEQRDFAQLRRVLRRIVEKVRSDDKLAQHEVRGTGGNLDFTQQLLVRGLAHCGLEVLQRRGAPAFLEVDFPGGKQRLRHHRVIRVTRCECLKIQQRGVPLFFPKLESGEVELRDGRAPARPLVHPFLQFRFGRIALPRIDLVEAAEHRVDPRAVRVVPEVVLDHVVRLLRAVQRESRVGDAERGRRKQALRHALRRLDCLTKKRQRFCGVPAGKQKAAPDAGRPLFFHAGNRSGRFQERRAFVQLLLFDVKFGQPQLRRHAACFSERFQKRDGLRRAVQCVQRFGHAELRGSRKPALRRRLFKQRQRLAPAIQRGERLGFHKAGIQIPRVRILKCVECLGSTAGIEQRAGKLQRERCARVVRRSHRKTAAEFFHRHIGHAVVERASGLGTEQIDFRFLIFNGVGTGRRAEGMTAQKRDAGETRGEAAPQPPVQ